MATKLTNICIYSSLYTNYKVHKFIFCLYILFNLWFCWISIWIFGGFWCFVFLLVGSYTYMLLLSIVCISPLKCVRKLNLCVNSSFWIDEWLIFSWICEVDLVCGCFCGFLSIHYFFLLTVHFCFCICAHTNFPFLFFLSFNMSDSWHVCVLIVWIFAYAVMLYWFVKLMFSILRLGHYFHLCFDFHNARCEIIDKSTVPTSKQLKYSDCLEDMVCNELYE